MQGKRIKETRKLLKITQNDLSSGKMARNLISEIENGNTPLTNKNAIEFLFQFLHYSLNRGISIDLQFLLEGIKEQKELNSLEEIIDMSSKLCSNIDDTEQLEQYEAAIRTVPHNLLRLELYNKIANQYKRLGLLNQFLNNKIKSVDLLVLENQCQALENTLFEMEPILLETQSNHDLLSIFLLSMGVFNRNEYKFNTELYYSIAIAYSRLDFYEEALTNVNKFIEPEENEQKMARGLLLKANIYYNLKRNDIARDLYSQASILLQKNNDYINYTIAIANIIDLIVTSNPQNNTTSAESISYYCSQLEQSLVHIKNANIKTKILSKIAYGYGFIGSDEKTLDIFTELLEKCHADKNFDGLVQVLNDSLDFYARIKKLESLEPYIQGLLTLLEHAPLTKSCEKAILNYLHQSVAFSPAQNILSQFIMIKFKR